MHLSTITRRADSLGRTFFPLAFFAIVESLPKNYQKLIWMKKLFTPKRNTMQQFISLGGYVCSGLLQLANSHPFQCRPRSLISPIMPLKSFRACVKSGRGRKTALFVWLLIMGTSRCGRVDGIDFPIPRHPSRFKKQTQCRATVARFTCRLHPARDQRKGEQQTDRRKAKGNSKQKKKKRAARRV
jgi:hypothetical protein